MCIEVCEVLFECVRSCPVCASRIMQAGDVGLYQGLSVCFWCVSIIRVCQCYSGFEVTCSDCDLKSALDHAAHDK